MAPSRALESGSSDATTHSAHVADPALRPFLAPTFDPIEYLNDSLPALSLSPSAPATATTLTLPELSTQTQTVLSQLSAHTSRLSGTLTQLTDEILRSGSRLAYEVEVLRGETLGLSEALTEGLSEDVALFVPDGLTVAAGDKQHEGGAADLPPYVTQLRTLSLVKDRLDTVIQIFGDAMEWTIPPSEVSITSSFISVSAPEPGSESHSREEKGHEVAKRLRDQVKELLASGADGDDGLEAAVARVEELRELAKVWKGTAEEKSRVKFVESLIRLVEERQAVLEQEANEQASRPSPKKPSPRKSSSGAAGFSDETGEQSRFGWPVRQGGYGFIDQLQKMRGGL
ncbi:MAG: hypothetical protein M1832_001104 [Thelocarpon impressellum]|nr:MAG: hypothetical protein M1832_001104 [Thelocarpon impressellum]